MAGEPDDIVLQRLPAMREQLEILDERQLEMMQRLGAVELGLANVSMRVDRIRPRLDQVERRIGLIEA